MLANYILKLHSSPSSSSTSSIHTETEPHSSPIQSIFNGKRVLELGAGSTGLPGLVASIYCQAKSVILSDCENGVLSVLAENVANNVPKEGDLETVSVVKYFWSEDWLPESKTGMTGMADSEGEGEDEQGKFDVIIASEIVYDSVDLELLVKTLSLCLKGKKGEEGGERKDEGEETGSCIEDLPPRIIITLPSLPRVSASRFVSFLQLFSDEGFVLQSSMETDVGKGGDGFVTRSWTRG